jgi:hypothetical protein
MKRATQLEERMRCTRARITYTREANSHSFSQEIPSFNEPVGSPPCPQRPTIGPYSEPNSSGSHFPLPMAFRPLTVPSLLTETLTISSHFILQSPEVKEKRNFP